LGVAWGAGHTASIALVALLVMALGVRLPEAVSQAGELLVAALLVWLGAAVLVRYGRGRWHMHRHQHDGASHLHLHSHAQGASHAHAHPNWDARRALGFGIAHGMAGSAAVLVLVVAAAPTGSSQAAYILAFGVGTIAGMLTVSWVLGVAVRAASRRGERLAQALHVASAVASLGAGVMLAYRTVGR
jgi:sulfite exporter TauE/SafE